jgi:hypothetical protein
MNTQEQVKARLWADIRKMSEDPGRFAKNPETDFTRNRKLSFEDLMRFLISMQSGTTAHELLKYFDYDTNTITNSAFYQQRRKLLPDALPFLLHTFNLHFPFNLYKGIYNLVASDGCEFNIARNPDDPDSFHQPNGKSTRGFNMLHTTSLYDLLSKRYLDCVVVPGRLKNEFRAICDLIDRYAYDGVPIFIGDRGFASYNFYAHAMENSRFFIVRAKDIIVRRLLMLDTLPEYIDSRADIILTRSQAKKNRSRPDLEEQYRYISSEVAFDYIEHGSADEYPLSLRVVRFEVADGTFQNMITNLPGCEFPTSEIKNLYRLRWGIEISFRDLKHTIGTNNFISKKIEYIEQEIWARMILFNFCAIITAHVVIMQNDNKHVYQVNFAMAMKICHHFIRIKEGHVIPDVVGLIGNYTLPIRLERNYARQHRFQLPASFGYRFS